MRVWKALAPLAIAIAGILALPAAWQLGYVSRVVAGAARPDGRLEAVCRGRLPEHTEYDLWFRAPGELFGRRLGFVGTEGMGRCRAVAWSPGGEVVAALSEGGGVNVFDGRTGARLGSQRLLPALEDGSYPSRRIVTRLRFDSPTAVTINHCARLWHTTRGRDDYWRCGPDLVTERLTLNVAGKRD